MRTFMIVLVTAILVYLVLYIIGKGVVAGFEAGRASTGPQDPFNPLQTTKPPMPSREELLAKGYNEGEVSIIMASDSYRNGTGRY